MKDEKLVLAQYKILDVIKYLNDKHLYPTTAGIFKMLKGYTDEETSLFMDCSAFGTLSSSTSRKISFYILALSKAKLITDTQIKESDSPCYCLSEAGKKALADYHKKHGDYPKSKARFKKTIYFCAD